MLWSACSSNEEDEEPQTTSNIYGVITNKATGEPIPTAGVTLNRITKWDEEHAVYFGKTIEKWELVTSTVTGSDGQYQFSNLSAGDYFIEVKKTGYIDIDESNIGNNEFIFWKVEAGKTLRGDVQMEKQAAVLRIVNDNGNEISNLVFADEISDVTRSFSIFNDSPATLEWEIVTSVPWISHVNKTSGTLNAGATQGIVVTVDKSNLPEVQNTTTIYVMSGNGNKAITVTIFRENNNPNYFISAAAGVMVQRADIVDNIVGGPSANELCKNSTVGGYTDWRLPTKEELQILYNERNIIGGFVTNKNTTNSYWCCYWSSGSTIDFSNGTVPFLDYFSSYGRCRCVRTLP